MVRVLSLGIMLLISYSNLFCMKSHVVFDADNILWEPNTNLSQISKVGLWSGWSAVRNIGFFNGACGLVSASYHQQNVSTLSKRFFEVLERIPYKTKQTNKETLIWNGNKAPALLINFLKGKEDHKKLLQKVITEIKKQKLSDEELMIHFARSAFDPKQNAESMQEIDDSKKLLKKIYDGKKYTIHLLVNGHQEALNQLKDKFPETFKYIKGTMLTSSRVNTLKSTLLYRKFFEISKISPKQTIFIESQKENTDIISKEFPSAKHYLVENKDINALSETLKKDGVI